MPPYRTPGAMQRQNDSQAAAIAYRRCKAVCESVEAHIAAHGTDNLAAVTAPYVGESATIKTSILMSVNRLCGRDARDLVREVLCC
jgi:hypothetical protein